MQPHELWPSPPHQQHPVLGGRTSQRASYAGRNKLAPQTNVAFDGVANHSDSDPLRLCMTNVFQAYITHLLTRSFLAVQPEWQNDALFCPICSGSRSRSWSTRKSNSRNSTRSRSRSSRDLDLLVYCLQHRNNAVSCICIHDGASGQWGMKNSGAWGFQDIE